MVLLSGFSRQYDYPRCHPPPEGPAYYRVSARTAYLTTVLNTYTLQRAFRRHAAVSLLRPRVTHAASHGLLTVSAIRLAVRLSVRSRLTPG